MAHLQRALARPRARRRRPRAAARRASRPWSSRLRNSSVLARSAASSSASNCGSSALIFVDDVPVLLEQAVVAAAEDRGEELGQHAARVGRSATSPAGSRQQRGPCLARVRSAAPEAMQAGAGRWRESRDFTSRPRARLGRCDPSPLRPPLRCRSRRHCARAPLGRLAERMRRRTPSAATARPPTTSLAAQVARAGRRRPLVAPGSDRRRGQAAPGRPHLQERLREAGSRSLRPRQGAAALRHAVRQRRQPTGCTGNSPRRRRSARNRCHRHEHGPTSALQPPPYRGVPAPRPSDRRPHRRRPGGRQGLRPRRRPQRRDRCPEGRSARVLFPRVPALQHVRARLLETWTSSCRPTSSLQRVATRSASTQVEVSGRSRSSSVASRAAEELPSRCAFERQPGSNGAETRRLALRTERRPARPRSRRAQQRLELLGLTPARPMTRSLSASSLSSLACISPTAGGHRVEVLAQEALALRSSSRTHQHDQL